MIYGFQITATDEQAIKAMQRIEKEMRKMTTEVKEGVEETKREFKDMGETAREVGMKIAEVFAIREIYNFGKELLHITAEFEAFQNVIKYSSRSIIDSQDNISYLEDAIKRLHMPMREAYEGFSEMQAGLIGTGIEGERLRRLFEGISTASTVLHLNPYNLQRTLYDLKEIGEQGLTMRVMRSLQTALPGIGEVIKETFHKSFQELEKEHVGGPAFLNKLAGGLQKHFASGLENAGHSLQAAMNDASNAYLAMQRQLGENLRPLFLEILKDVKETFNSGLVKAFVANIVPLVKIVATAVKLWLEYKAVMLAIKLIEEGRIAVLSAMAMAQGKMTIATREGEQSIESFAKGINGFKWNLFAMGIGSAIELFLKFRDANKKAKEAWDEFIDDKTGKSKLQGMANDNEEPIQRIKAAMADTTLMKDKNYRDDLLLRTNNLANDISTNIREVMKPIMDSARPQFDEMALATMPKEQLEDHYRAFRADSASVNRANDQVAGLKDISKNLIKMGAKLPNYQATAGSGTQSGSLTAMGLAGAKGGLGEAKTVNIHIDTIMKVAVGMPKDLKNAAEDSAEVILRTLNNIAYGQSRTM